MDTFVKIGLSARLAGLVASFALATVTTLSVCPVLAASLAKDAHRCCKTSGTQVPASDDSGCRTKCAGSASVIITPVGSTAGSSFVDQTPLALVDAYVPKPVVETSVTPTPRPAGPPRPIYERNSALLI